MLNYINIHTLIGLDITYQDYITGHVDAKQVNDYIYIITLVCDQIYHIETTIM